jgi:L-asparaginase / beta-aspartyl-peptidase
MSQPYSLMIHGGAGALEDLQYEATEAEFRQSVLAILAAGRARLAEGASALDVVEYCVTLLEDDRLYNAGRGSVLNALGQVEMDAALMNGQDLRAGGVTCIKQVKNPIGLARRVLDQGDHVLLAADGALEFAKFCQVELCGDDYFITPARVTQLAAAQAAGRMTLDHERIKQKLGTVGAVARDMAGNLAGVFADNETCAVSATGYGEQFLRTVFAKTIASYVQFQGMDAAAAAQAGIDDLVRKVNGDGGAIVIDRSGRVGSAQSTSGLIHGWIELGGEAVCKLG